MFLCYGRETEPDFTLNKKKKTCSTRCSNYSEDFTLDSENADVSFTWSALAANNLTSSSSMVLFDWLKTGFTHLRQEDILQLLFDLNRLRSSAVWMCLRDMRVCLCVSTVLRGWMCKSKVFLLQRAHVCDRYGECLQVTLCARVCVWLWLHDNINSLSSFVTIRLYLNRINHTSHVWHAHVHLAFDSADTYMCRPTCETLASSSRELCSHNNGQQWEQ